MNSAIDYLHNLHVSPLGAWLLVAYALVIGGAFGSFLNVVAYRLPLGMSLNHPGSRCPHCGKPIRWYHNLPVFGWLMLRGRCYDCGAPIAARYPLVELIVSLASGLVLWSALAPALIDGQPEYAVDLLIVGFRLLLLYTLFAAALLEFDANRLPLRLLIGVTAIAALGVSLVPELRPAGGYAPAAPPLVASAFAAAAALVAALLAWPALLSSTGLAPVRDALALAVALLLLAIVLGTSALLVIAASSAAIVLAARLSARVWTVATNVDWATALLVATLGWMIAVSPAADPLAAIHFGSSSGVVVFHFQPRMFLSAGIVVAVLSLAARFVSVRLPGRSS